MKIAFGVEPSDRRYRLRLARYPALAATVAAFVRAQARPVRLLDVGVGRGRTRRYLEPLGVAERVAFVGLDLDARMPQRVHACEAWRLVRADASRGLPFATAAFDVVVCEQLLEHMADPAAVMDEIARCMRPGGLLVLGAPTFPAGIAALRPWLAPAVHERSTSTHTHVQTFSLGALREIVRRGGRFHVRDARGFRMFFLSGGPLAPLEDLRAWWRLNAAVGRALPGLCAEVQVTAVRNPSPPMG